MCDLSIANAFTIIPSDTFCLGIPTTAIYLGISGDLKVELCEGNIATFKNLPSGVFHPIQATRIFASGTTADEIIGVNAPLSQQQPINMQDIYNNFSLILEDNFERPDATIGINILATSGTADSLDNILTDTGQRWTTNEQSEWYRDSSGLYLSSCSGWERAYVDSLVGNCTIEADLTWYGNAGFIFRLDSETDGNFFYVVINNYSFKIYKVQEWNDTLIASYTGQSLISGTTYHIELVLDDANISFYVDNVLCMSVTNTFNQNSTCHGLFNDTSVNTNRWNNFSIVSDEGNMPVNILGVYWEKEYPDNEWNAQISTNYAQSEEKSLRMELRKTDNIVSGSKRSEIARRIYEEPLEEHWYCCSIYLPGSGAEEYLDDSQGCESILQWHNVPDEGEEWTSPPLGLLTWGSDRGNIWSLARNWDANIYSTDESIEANNQYEYINLGSYLNDKGKWTDWAFHIKWGWLEAQNPILEVYKNGILVCERNGQPNTTNDQSGVYMKAGIYKWEWAEDNYGGSEIDTRVVYYDNIRDYKKVIS